MQERIVTSPYLWIEEINNDKYVLNILSGNKAIIYSEKIKYILENFKNLITIPKELKESEKIIDKLINKRYLLKESDLFIPVLNMELEITNFCNANCYMCPRVNLQRKKGYMDEGTFKYVIEELKHRPINEIEICGVGEPLLHKDVIRYIKSLKSIDIKKVKMVTNASLLTKDKADALIEAGLDEIMISFHSIHKEKYEKMMSLSFDNVLENITYLIENYKDKLNIIITCVLSEKNIDEKEEFIKFWKERKINNIVFQNIQSRVGNLCHTEKRDLKCRCVVFEQGLFVSWDGNYLSCSNDFKGISNLGSIKTKSFDQFLKCKNHMINNKKMFGFCNFCDYDFRKVDYLESDFYKYAKYKEKNIE